MKIIANNKKATFEYEILDKYEAGIKLQGTEVKSIREGSCNINDSYVIIKNNKPYILNMNIAKYKNGNIFNHEETRTRELLLNKSEIRKLEAKVKEKGLSIVALKLYFKEALVKVEIALARGKNLRDKRDSIKERDVSRSLNKELKNRY
jgi:SsrA-binding protein